jgi:hypothetical protein
MNFYTKGDDITGNIKVSDLLGEVFNLENFASIILVIYSKKNNTILQRFSKETKENYDNFLSLDNGEIKFIINASKTATADENEYYFEVKFGESNTAYENNIKYTTKKASFGKFIECSTKNTF